MPVPTGEQTGRWRQYAPIPTFADTKTDGNVILYFAYPPDSLTPTREQLRTVSAQGRTIKEAESRLRESLPFDIEAGREEVAGIPAGEPMRKDAGTVSQYFEDTTPQRQ
jgi:hypothetical protein